MVNGVKEGKKHTHKAERCYAKDLKAACVLAAGPMAGARLVLPGPYLDGENIYALMDMYKVTISTGRST